jgi:hypothetical protein
MAKGRGQKAEGKRLADQCFSIWRESRVTLATAILQCSRETFTYFSTSIHTMTHSAKQIVGEVLVLKNEFHHESVGNGVIRECIQQLGK